VNQNSKINWINFVESRRSLIIGSVLLISLVALFVSSLRNPVAYDSFWHLQMGKDWIVNGLSPWIDHYSYTFGGEAISNPPVMFQALLHFSVSQFGVETGFLLIKLASFFLVLVAVYILLRKLKASVIIFALVLPVIAFLLQLRVFVRPELFSYFLYVVALYFLFRPDKKISKSQVLSMMLLALVWTNYHSTSIVGFVIFAAYFLDCAVEQYDKHAPSSTWFKWFLSGLLVFAVGFVNPAWSHPVLESFSFSSDWKQLIAEYQHDPTLLKLAGLYVVGLIAVITPFLAFKQRKFGHILVWATLVYAAVEVSRMIPVSGIVVTLLMADLLVSSNFPQSLLSENRKKIRLTGLICLIAICTTLFSIIERSRNFMSENRMTATRYPEAMIEYMKKRETKSRVFNDYGLGGYLIYNLAPNAQVYIDGRTNILYPLEHMKWHSALVNSPEELEAELNKYDVDTVAWTHTDPKLLDVLMEISGFDLDFMDAWHAMYVRGPGNFPLLGKLMSQPSCWQPELSEKILAEGRIMEEILPGYSRLFPFVNLLLEYDLAIDKETFLDEKLLSNRLNDEIYRFAAFRQMELGNNVRAFDIFESVEKRRIQDFLAQAASALLDRDFELFASTLNEISSRFWQHVSGRDLQVLLNLYSALEEFRALTPYENASKSNLQSTVRANSVSENHLDIDTSAFCPFSLVANLQTPILDPPH
jgi:hypothetical protein